MSNKRNPGPVNGLSADRGWIFSEFLRAGSPGGQGHRSWFAKCHQTEVDDAINGP